MNNENNVLTDKEYSNLESRLRRKLRKNGYVLRKRKNIYGFTGYMIVDAESNFCVDGYIPTEYGLDLRQAANFAK